MNPVVPIHSFFLGQSLVEAFLRFLKGLLLKDTEMHAVVWPGIQMVDVHILQESCLALYHCGFCISLVSLCVVRMRQARSADTAPSRIACFGSHTA